MSWILVVILIFEEITSSTNGWRKSDEVPDKAD